MKILAAFTFFTRLPLWRLADIPKECYKNIVAYWSLTGWLTAGLMVLVLYGASLILPFDIAVVFAILSRLLLTGCLHEDGLADFLDGFGGGTTRERTLSIMKDSHIGSYGVIGLILYFLTLYLLLSSLPLEIAACAILAGDPFAKGVSSMVINVLPYGRTEEQAKNKTVYSRMNFKEAAISFFFTVAALFWLPEPLLLIAALLPILTWLLLIRLMKRRIAGYTGDCCGALFLLCEWSFYLGIAIINFTTI